MLRKGHGEVVFYCNDEHQTAVRPRDRADYLVIVGNFLPTNVVVVSCVSVLRNCPPLLVFREGLRRDCKHNPMWSFLPECVVWFVTTNGPLPRRALRFVDNYASISLSKKLPSVSEPLAWTILPWHLDGCFISQGRHTRMLATFTAYVFLAWQRWCLPKREIRLCVLVCV